MNTPPSRFADRWLLDVGSEAQLACNLFSFSSPEWRAIRKPKLATTPTKQVAKGNYNPLFVTKVV
ncbi:hypothetical protein BC351_29790 [Paenibacillus ferrarius]|uniref:Uncharacterized protein n=1 Tax=Paenibacillus ferrarius TaxID=1469647 RepID=A0A1V4HGI4_9BACL|nr:hypothetical protein BC351_29790 [Paenibacillus ferrarius]